MISIPIYIPVYNNPTYTKNFLTQLRRYNFENIFIIDNNSEYLEMVKFLKEIENEVNVVRLPENKGPHYILRDQIFYNDLPELFILSDPDLELSTKLKNNFVDELIAISKKFKIGKVGLALEIPELSELKRTTMFLDGKEQNLIDWEKQFWNNCIGETQDGDKIYLTTLDTQFAVYNKTFFNPQNRYEAIRVAGNFTAKHLGLYKDTIVPLNEKIYYENSSKYSYFEGKLNNNLEPIIELSILEYTQLIEEKDSLSKEIKILDSKNVQLNHEIQSIYNSRTWKVLEILRILRRFFTK